MTRGHRFESLDAWRGICALLVAMEHLNTDGFLRRNDLVHHAYRFVDFFFVLSGFVIAHAYRDGIQRDRREARPFLIRRIGRLWPLHVAMLGALIVVELGLVVGAHAGFSMGPRPFTGRDSLAAIAPNVLLVHSWGFMSQTTWNTPSWSISTEMFAYLLFAGLCAIAPARWLDRIAAVILVGSAAVLLFVAPIGMQSTYDYGLLRCTYGFMMGVLVRRAWGWHAPRVGLAGELAVLAAVIGAVAFLPAGWPALAVTPVFAVAVWVFASEDGAISRQLRRAWPQALGAWSYSIYMVHVLVMVGLLMAAMLAAKAGLHLFARVDDVATIVGPGWLTTAITLGYVAVVIGLSSLTYRYIELPGQRWFGRWARRPAASNVAVRAGN